MALSDPLSITINSVATALPRVMTSGQSAQYRSADGLITFDVIQSLKAGIRRTVLRLERRKLVTDPLTTLPKYVSEVKTYTFSRPDGVDFTEAELIDSFSALNTMLSASTNTVLKKVLGLES